MYLTYETYQTMGGGLDETAFNDFEFEAEAIVNWYTFRRIPKWYKSEDDYPDELKDTLPRLMMFLIKFLQLVAQSQTLGQGDTSESSTEGIQSAVASQSNDGVSISYNVIPASTVLETKDAELAKAVKMYLSGIVDSLGRNLLYRGLYPGE